MSKKKRAYTGYGEGTIFYSNSKNKWMGQINIGKDEKGNTPGGYFTVEYKVFSKKDSNLTKEVQCIIRCMNRV